ncbi:MAG TPA: UDP-3-O-(3-hydroxymyristoyl)glucosamine N-acyltransferase [Blastocatellia bacterium]|nr:UDP-3-O-(3-hydroxymyristoyl)glucosamine N-acyltransferase [Blastocatellia bacterium]
MHTLGRLAEIIKAELIGDPEAVIRRAQSFDAAQEGDITFATGTYCERINESRATAVIVADKIPDANCNLLIASNPKLAFARAIQALHAEAYLPIGISDDLIIGKGSALGRDLSIHPRVTIGRNSVIGNRVTLHPGVVIGDDCRVGDDTVIHPNVSIYDRTEIGNRVIIHAGTVIGADGFGFVPDEEGRQVKLLQLGCVIIEDDCEIGANCAIDRGGFKDTILRRGVKLDNFIQVGHNCEIGEDTVVAALTGFSGGTRIGRRCVIAGQVGTVEHVTIGDGAIITGKAVVTKDVRGGAVIGGIPARDFNAWRRSQVLYSRLPELTERLKTLEKIVRDLAQTFERGDQ